MTGSYSSCFKREKSATLVLMAIVVVFIMCQSIKIVPDIWEAVRNEQVCKSQTTNKTPDIHGAPTPYGLPVQQNLCMLDVN